MTHSLKGANVLLLGGSGGIGGALAHRLALAGVASLVTASHAQSELTLPGTPLLNLVVDMTNQNSVQALADQVRERDISFVLNCAGVNSNASVLAPEARLNARREMEVNYFGLLNVGLAFGPLLAARGGGVMASVLSFLAHVSLPSLATYCASKAAAQAVNLALRAEFKPQGVKVCGIYPMAVDPRMSTDQAGEKMSPSVLADEIVYFLSSSCEDLYPGEAQQAYEAWLRDPRGFQSAMLAG